MHGLSGRGSLPLAENPFHLRGSVRLRVPTPTATAPGLLRRVLLPLTAALLISAGLATPAAAEPAPLAPPAAPVVTASTTGPVFVGTPVTMTVSPGDPADQVSGYAWMWGPPASLPVYGTVPSCSWGDTGTVHFVCGSTVTLRVAPPDLGFSDFTVWALDASGRFSAPSDVPVSTLFSPEALYPVTHQWTTDQAGAVPAARDCGPGRLTVACVPDTAGVDARHANGARPLLLPRGVTWDASGSGVPGVLTFGPGNRRPAVTPGAVVDTRQSFTAGAWLTPTAADGTAATAIAQTGPGGTGFELGRTADGRWQFRVRSASGISVVTAPNPTFAGAPVFVAGVADAVNRELRLYVNGLAAVAGYTPARGVALDGPVTVGGRSALPGFGQPWVGQVGNPVVAQAALPGIAISRLASGGFYFTDGGGID